jgi:hypothetical protein
MPKTQQLIELAAGQMRLNGPAPLSTNPELGPFIYYIQCGSFVKIGTSINPESRCDQLQRGGKAIRPSIWVGNPKLIAYVPGNVAQQQCLLEAQVHQSRYEELTGASEELNLAEAFRQAAGNKTALDLEWIEAFA